MTNNTFVVLCCVILINKVVISLTSRNTLTAKIFGENIFGEEMFGGFFIKSPKISVNNFGEKVF